MLGQTSGVVAEEVVGFAGRKVEGSLLVVDGFNDGAEEAMHDGSFLENMI